MTDKIIIQKKKEEIKVQNVVSHNYKNIRLKLNFSKLYHSYTAYKVLNLIENRENIQLLDYCCGTSNLFPFFNRLFKNSLYYGMDISENMLKIGNERYKHYENFNTTCQDGEDLQYRDEQFDIVISRAALHHLPSLYRSFYHIHRVLKEKGELILLEPVSNIFIRNLRRLKYKRSKAFSALHKSFSHKEIMQVLEKFNFELEKKEKFGLIAYPLSFPDIFPFLEKINYKNFLKYLIILDEYLLKLPIINSFNWGVILKLRKM
ncbi:MAG: class I SAM-dependent methyltransferase [Promethearchaeota archaeon]